MGRVITLTREDIYWPFRGEPQIFTQPVNANTYKSSVNVDPFPAYAHDAELVRQVMQKVEDSFPIEHSPDYYLLPCEDVGRTNGYAQRDWIYNGSGEERTYEGHVILSAKRIPPHPAMTRYLVAHEYGHHVQWAIETKRGMKDESVSELTREYMALRPGTQNGDGGGLWHSKTGELFANDFRILVAGVEPEFWPHDGFPHPHDCDAVRAFWERERKT
jgi:hypothetical protein